MHKFIEYALKHKLSIAFDIFIIFVSIVNFVINSQNVIWNLIYAGIVIWVIVSEFRRLEKEKDDDNE